MVIAGQPVFNEGRKDDVLNPVLIVEVLSHSTEDFERENKFRFYRSIPELLEYVLVDQMETKRDQPLTLAELRERANFTQAQLAVTMGVSVSTVSDWENGKKEPRLKHFRLLMEVLGCTFEELCEAFDQVKRRE